MKDMNGPAARPALLGCLCLLLGLLLLAPAARAASFVPQGDMMGSITFYAVQPQDNLYELARRFDIGIVELLAANPGVDVWQPEPGTRLMIPGMYILPRAQRRGIVINLSALRLYYFMDDGHVMSVPIGIGREGWQTPLGTTRIIRKETNPIWTPPPSIRKQDPTLPARILPGPDNPLGDYAFYLGWHSILIHGTNRPYGIGRRSSHGCIRLYPEDIAALYAVVNPGTPVTVVDEPYNLGWQGDNLYLQVMPTQTEDDIVASYEPLMPEDNPDIRAAVSAAAGDAKIDWNAATAAIKNRSGVPVLIGTR